MKFKKNKGVCILLTATGGFGTTSLIDCLKNNYEGRKIKIICTDIKRNGIAHHKADGFYQLPKGSSNKYIQRLIAVCKKEKVNVIMPGSAPEILAISKNIEKLKNCKIFPTVSEYQTIKKILDKGSTYSLLQAKNIPIPKFYQVKNIKEFQKALDRLGFPKRPVCFKPSRYFESGGARGFRILRKRNSIEKIILRDKPGSVEIDYESALRFVKQAKNLDLLVMEYLSGEEFSVYVFADNGRMLYCIPNLRQRVEQFYSFEAEIKNNKKILEICKKIVETMNFSFNLNIQLKLSRNGFPKVIEINPRIGGTIALSSAAGINLPYFAVKQALNEKIPINKKSKKAKMIRYWKEFFITENGYFEFSDKGKKFI